MAGGATEQTAYTYDNAGNRLTKTVGGQTTQYTYNALDQLVTAGSAQYSYDARGNLTSITDGAQISRCTYDARDHLTSASMPDGQAAHYTYDADGRLVGRETSQAITHYLWDIASLYGDIVLETDQAGIAQAGYILGGAELLAQQRGSAMSYYLRDGQGSVRALTDSSGAISDQYAYDAFGQLLEQSGSTVNPYRYTGQRLDDLTGLYSLRARFYNPADGRFLTRDTYPIDRANPVELNRYSYVRNNPINLSDPTGYMAMVEFSANVREGAKHGAFIGAAGGFALSSFTYFASWMGWCGAPGEEWAAQTNPFLFIAGGTLLGAGFGAIFGGLAEMKAVYALTAAVIGGIVSVGTLAHATADILKHGVNACNSTEFVTSFVGLGLSGLEATRAMSVLLRGARGPMGPSGPPPSDGPGGPPPSDGPGGTPPSDGPGGTPPSDGPGGAPPSDGPGGTPPSDGPGGTPPSDGPGGTPPSDGPGGTPPSDGPGGMPPSDGPGSPPSDGPGGTPPSDGPGSPPSDGPNEPADPTQPTQPGDDGSGSGGPTQLRGLNLLRKLGLWGPNRALDNPAGSMIPSNKLTTLPGEEFNSLPTGAHGDKESVLLWTIDDNGANFIPEQTPWDTGRGVVTHTNISNRAYAGGEAWHTGPNQVTVSSASRAFGFNRELSPAMLIEAEMRYNAAVDHFRSLGLEVIALPFGTR